MQGMRTRATTSLCAAACAIALLAGCAQNRTTMVVRNATDQTLVVEPAVQDTFTSDWATSVEIAPGEAWSGSWSLPRRAWVLVQLRKAGDPEPRQVQEFNVKSLHHGQQKSYRAMTERGGRLILVEGE